MRISAKQLATAWVDENAALLSEVHLRIWDWAEVGLKELRTGALLAGILEKHGFTVERGVAGMPSAFVATYGSGSPTIGMMAELDALPGLSPSTASSTHVPTATNGFLIWWVT